MILFTKEEIKAVKIKEQEKDQTLKTVLTMLTIKVLRNNRLEYTSPYCQVICSFFWSYCCSDQKHINKELISFSHQILSFSHQILRSKKYLFRTK